MKYHNGSSMTCGHCDNHLLPLDLKENPRHVYDLGQLYTCSYTCKKSSMWTNSVRNANNLLKFFDGQTDRYYNGFCNDQFCGFCFGYIQPLKNGFDYHGKRLDRYGCMNCKQNEAIIVDVYKKDAENNTTKLIDWYKRHINELKNYIN